MKGQFLFCSPLKSPTPTPMCKYVARACLGYKSANYTSKVNITEDFQMSPKWKSESRLLNNALAVYYLLNQTTQIAQIVIHKMNTVIVLLQILMWTLSKTPLKIYRERNNLLHSGCYKHVYFLYTFVTLTFRTEVILVRR